MSPEAKSRAKQIAGEIIVEEINNYLDASKSPVSGGAFQRKKADGTISTLLMDGDMRSQITFNESESDAVEVGIFEDAPEIERLKSFNHNTGDTLPQRKFIAAPNQKFKKPIMDRVNREIEQIRTEEKELNRIINEILEEI